jgi:hypothetical protein
MGGVQFRGNWKGSEDFASNNLMRAKGVHSVFSIRFVLGHGY